MVDLRYTCHAAWLRDRVAVECVIASQKGIRRTRKAEPQRLHELHSICPRHDVREPVHAVGIRGCRVNHDQGIERTVCQIDRCVWNSGLQRVLNAVGIQIVPYKIANGCPMRIARINGFVGRTIGQRVDLRDPCAYVGVGVDRVIRFNIRCGARIPKDRVESHPVIAGSASMQVQTTASRRENAGVFSPIKNAIQARIENFHTDPVDATEPIVLNAVVIGVIPHKAFQGGR